MMFYATPIASLFLLLPTHAQAGREVESAKAFVRQFYAWYTPIAIKNHGDPAFGIAIKKRPNAFTAELVRALQSDFDAQVIAHGTIVGLDGDPFLQSQDPAAHHKIGKMIPKGHGFLVHVHGVRAGKAFPEPAVIAEVQRVDGRWVFVNFHSPDGWNILELLQKLKSKREVGAFSPGWPNHSMHSTVPLRGPASDIER